VLARYNTYPSLDSLFPPRGACLAPKIEKNRLSPDIVKFVAPLGATVNMNGTALYEASTVIFLAQVNNHPLDMADTFVIAFTATLAAVGAAAIPSAGLVTMVMVLTAVGMDDYIKDIAFVLAIDWFLDRFRTVVNVEGDCFGCGVVNYYAESGSCTQDGQPYSPRASAGFTAHVDITMDELDESSGDLGRDDEEIDEQDETGFKNTPRTSNLGHAPLPPG